MNVAESIVTTALTLGGLIVAVSLFAVMLSRNAQTPQVIQSAGAAFSQSLTAAEAPVSSGGGFGSPPGMGYGYIG